MNTTIIFILKGLQLVAGGLNAVNTPGNDVLLLATPEGVEASLAVTTFGVKSHVNAIRGCRFTQPGVVSLNPRLMAVISSRYSVALAEVSQILRRRLQLKTN